MEEWKITFIATARELLGSEVILHFEGDKEEDCCARVSGDSTLDKGDQVTLWINMNRVCFFDAETGENILLEEGERE